ncbi:hypothetical protein ACS0TY_023737 [Phlomoides rotata]
MAMSFAMVTSFSLLLGMGSALETLCGQAYGAEKHRMLGVYTQRAIMVLVAVGIALSFILYNTSFILTQHVVVPMMIISGVTATFHVFLCWLFVFKIELGSKGAALANSTSYWINAVLLALYVMFSSACSRTFTGLSREAFNDIPRFLRLAVPSDPKLETSTLSISLNTCSMVYTISVGLGGAVSTRVSNELGAGNSQQARFAICVAAVNATSVGAIVAAATILGKIIQQRNKSCPIFSQNHELLEDVDGKLCAHSSILELIMQSGSLLPWSLLSSFTWVAWDCGLGSSADFQVIFFSSTLANMSSPGTSSFIGEFLL